MRTKIAYLLGRNKMRKKIVDTDLESDYAVGIMMALFTPDIELLAMTIVGSNVCLQQTR